MLLYSGASHFPSLFQALRIEFHSALSIFRHHIFFDLLQLSSNKVIFQILLFPSILEQLNESIQKLCKSDILKRKQEFSLDNKVCKLLRAFYLEGRF